MNHDSVVIEHRALTESGFVVVTSTTIRPTEAAVPLHRGHHPIWVGQQYQVDICNMVDDVVIRVLSSGKLYRFPIDDQLIDWVQILIRHMDANDVHLPALLKTHNALVRQSLLVMAMRRLREDPRLELNTFEPGVVGVSSAVDGASSENMLEVAIKCRPEDEVH